MYITGRQPQSSVSGRESSRNSWLRKAQTELLAVGRVVRLYPKSTLLWPLMLLAFMLGVGVWGVTHVAKFEETSARDRAAILAFDASVWIQQQLENAVAPVMLTAAMVSYNPNFPTVKKVFDSLAPAMLAQAPPGSVRVMQLVPYGVIAALYPLEGNEEALWVDLFGSPTNREGAIKTVADRTLTLVGPLNFVQRGTGLIVRQPIFVNPNATGAGTSSNVSAEAGWDMPRPLNPACGPPCATNATSHAQFWGFSSALVNLDALTGAKSSKLASLESLGYQYELRAVQGDWGPGGPEAPSASVQLAVSAELPRDPVEASIRLPNSQWVLRVAPGHGWASKWCGGLLAGVVLLAVATSVLLFAALVSWRRHQLLLEALLPQRVLKDLRHEDPASPLFDTCPKIRTTDTPADLLLNMMGDLLEGHLPHLADVVFIRTALLRNLDLYTPLDVRGQIKAADLDSEVAQALVQQLVGARRISYGTSRQLNSQFGGGGSADGDAKAALSYDIDTLSGALAFVLSPEAMALDAPVDKISTVYGLTGGIVAAGVRANCEGGGGGCGAAAATSPTQLSNPHSCPLLVRGAAPLLSSATCTTASFADVVAAAPPSQGCCEEVGDDCDGGAAVGVSDCPRTPTMALAASRSAQLPQLQLQIHHHSAAHPAQGHGLYDKGSSAFHALMRASAAGCFSGGTAADAAAVAAARALLPPPTPVPPLSSLASPGAMQLQQPHHMQWPHNNRRNRSCSTNAGNLASGCGGGSSGGAAGLVVVCATCGSSMSEDATVAASAATAAAPSVLCSGASGSGSSKLMAGARRLRPGGGAAATDHCPQNGGRMSANGAVTGPPSGSGGGGGGGGGGGVKPNSRLALAMSYRSERPPSQPSPRAPPQQFLAIQPSSPRPPGGGGGAAVASAVGVTSSTAGSGCRGDGVISTLLSAPVPSTALPFDAVREPAAETEDLELQLAGVASAPPPGTAAAVEAAAVAGGRPPAPILEEVERLLADADGSWHFDAFALREASGGHALSALGFFLMTREGLTARFGVRPVALARLLRRLEAGYLDNPYHNAVHAADVLQTLHVLLHGAQLHVHYLEPLGLMAAYFAAIIHDYGHPGLTGDFLVATSHPLALTYNDRSPLENHHCAAAFGLMRRHPELDVLTGLSQQERSSFRKLVIELVLATDMKLHFSILSHFNTVHRLAAYSQQQHQQHTNNNSQHGHQHAPGGGGSLQVVSSGRASTARGPSFNASSPPPPPPLHQQQQHAAVNATTTTVAVVVEAVAGGDGGAVAATAGPAAAAAGTAIGAGGGAGGGGGGSGFLRGPGPRPVDETERLLSLQLALKCADIGNLGRELECYQRWVLGLEEEFFRQGDRERSLGLPISPLSDRTKQGVSKSQIGFFDFVALPLVHAMAAAFPGAQPLFSAFLSNYNYWKRADAAASQDSSANPSAAHPGPAPSTPAPSPPPPPPPQQQQQ